MLFFKKKNIKKSPELRYIMNFLSYDRYTLAEYYDGFVETTLDVRREDGGFYLEKTGHHYNADHYPRWIYHHIPISAQEVARLEAAGLLMPGPGY